MRSPSHPSNINPSLYILFTFSPVNTSTINQHYTLCVACGGNQQDANLNLNFQLLLQLSIQNIWASIQNVWCAQHSAQLSYILYGDFSHTFCMGISSTLRAPIRNTWASDLSYILCGDFSHTFCVGISLIHFVWGFLQL